MICTNCQLRKLNTKDIHNRGTFPAKILLITEYPSVMDETIGKILSGKAKAVFESLLKDAFDIQNNIPLSYAITSIIKCRPTDKLKGPTREPKASEVLSCTLRLMRDIKKINPTIIFLSGKLVEQYYKKEFPDAYILQPMGFIARQGGQLSPWYKSNLRVILDALKK